MVPMSLVLYIQQPINHISHVFIFVYLITHCRYFHNSLPIFSMCLAPYAITDYIYFSRMILRGQWDSDLPAEAFKMQTKKGVYSARIWSDPSQWLHNEHFWFTQPFIQCADQKKTSKLCVAGLCAGNSPVIGEFPAQRTSNAKNVSIWWRHHASQY